MLKIYTLGEDVLREQADQVVEFDNSLKELITHMQETMYDNDGIGLAATQVGVKKQLFICRVQGDKLRVFINPEIIETSLEQTCYEEGCLSIPGVFAEILRPAAVKVQARDANGKLFSLNADGLLSRVIQHEMDHLKGTLFVDHLDEKKREKAVKQMERNGRIKI